MQAAPRSLASLLEGLIDYAGLFPPASLPMAGAVERYRRARSGPWAPVLGRFVVPAARLGELARTAGREAPAGAEPWRVSALVSLPLQKAESAAIDGFNAGHGGDAGWRARVEALEAKADSADEVEAAAQGLPGYDLFVEVSPGEGARKLLDAVAACGCRAKVRTGGTSPAAFPPVELLAAFLDDCARRRLPFKATAGLHHPVRGRHPLSYEPNAPTATMHGFLNVFVAAALLTLERIDRSTAALVLNESDASAFVFDDEGAAWRDRAISAAEIRDSRRLALGFGSCSFDEPMDDLAALGLVASAPSP